MGRRGPPPASPAIQAMRKTAPSRRRGGAGANAMATATAAVVMPPRTPLPTKPPKHLVDEAAECWVRVTTIQSNIAAAGQQPYIGEPERELLEVACINYRQWRMAVRIFNERLDRLLEDGDDKLPLAQLAPRVRGDAKELVVNSYQKLLERTEERVRSGFRALGLPLQMPQMIVELEQESATGDRQKLRLLS